MADKYILKVTAGPSYEDQTAVPVNTEEPIRITNEHLTADLRIRVQNYRGLPEGSPKTSPYFEHEKHKSDLYSLAFTFTPKEDLNGHDIVFGNDFDHPIKDKLPPGFNQAFKIATWFIDPGLYGDVYADEPYLYGPLLSSINTFRIGPKDDKEQEKVEEVRANQDVVVFEEGADGDGQAVRDSLGLPAEGPARQKFFLTEKHLKDITLEKNREYACDFFNPYLDFNGECSKASESPRADNLMSRLCASPAWLQSDPWSHNSDHLLLGWPAAPVSLNSFYLQQT